MKIIVLVTKVFGIIWIIAAVLLILVGLYGVWIKEGFTGVTQLLSPFNVTNWIVTILTLAPGFGLLLLSEKLRLKTDN